MNDVRRARSHITARTLVGCLRVLSAQSSAPLRPDRDDARPAGVADPQRRERAGQPERERAQARWRIKSFRSRCWSASSAAAAPRRKSKRRTDPQAAPATTHSTRPEGRRRPAQPTGQRSGRPVGRTGAAPSRPSRPGAAPDGQTRRRRRARLVPVMASRGIPPRASGTGGAASPTAALAQRSGRGTRTGTGTGRKPGGPWELWAGPKRTPSGPGKGYGAPRIASGEAPPGTNPEVGQRGPAAALERCGGRG